MLSAADNESFYMNVNLSNVAATSKVSVSDSSNKVAAEDPESKGFFETLAGVFTDSQKSEKAVAKPDVSEASAETTDDAAKVASVSSEGESQEKVVADGEKTTSSESTDALLTHNQSTKSSEGADNEQAVDSEKPGSAATVAAVNSSVDGHVVKSEDGSESVSAPATSSTTSQTQNVKVADTEQAQSAHVKNAMGEGEQLLGRIEQANQTLKPTESSVDSGKALPPELNVTQTGNDKAQSVPLTPEQQAILAAGSVQQGEAVSSTGNEKVVFDANGKPVVVASKDMTEQQASNLVQQQTSAQAPAQIDWNSPSAQAAHTEATVNATTQAAVNGQVVAQGVQPQTMQGAEVFAGAEALTASAALQQGLSGDAEAVPVKRITLDELHIIDTKLAQGKPLSKQETDVIEGLKTGELVADIPEQDLAQFVALPSDVKAAMVEHQVAHTPTRVAASAVAAQQAHHIVAQDAKHAAAQATAQPAVATNVDKAAMSAMPEALVAASMNPTVHATSSAELSKKVMNASLAAGALKGASSKQDKPEPQHGLAGQLQAAAGQQGVTAQQQARVDAAQQAQLPLQLTKELANDQVAEKVQMMMSKNLKNLDIRLDPPELGRMQIRMTMNNDLANVHFTVANPQARDLIEQTMPRLREMLAQQGMQLADSSVQQQSSGQQQSGYANAEQNGQGGQGRGFSGQSDENFDADTNLDLNVVSKRDGISFYA